MRLALRAAAAGAIGWVAFAFRFQAPDFHNDHFEHLSMARQVLFGELPGRDFFDPGRPLTVLLSAGAQALFGHSLFGEALLTIGALALGAAIVFWLAAGVARSYLAAALAALVVIAITPRLYSYPKIIVFAAALLVLWWYVDRPSIRRAVALAGMTVFALLMRHDFGVYIGVVSACALLMVRLKADPTTVVGSAFRRTTWRPVAAYFIAGALLVSPYLLWMQQNGLLATSTATGVGSLAGAARLTWRQLHFDLSNGIAHIDPVRGRIAVRWSGATTPDDRARLEQQYGLVDGHPDDESTSSYGLTNDSRDNLRTLVVDPHIDDTAGINRGAATLDAPAWTRWLSRIGVPRLVIGPFFSAEDSEAWLYAAVWLIPLIALCLIAVRVKRRGATMEAIKVGAAALLGIELNLFLLRGSLDSRLPDVVVPAAIVGAWLLAESAHALRRPRTSSGGWASLVGRGLVGTAVAAMLVVLGTAVSAYSGVTVGSLFRASVSPSRLRDVARSLHERPIDSWSSPHASGVSRLARYVFDCTTADDRLLLVAYEPQVFYYAERLFAGGIEHFHQRRFSSAAEQGRVVAALRRQRVPLVIVEDDRARMLQDDYAQVFAYIRERYVPVGETRFQAHRLWRIYADRTATERRKWDDLPCFAG
jgi:hypothetical protein